MLGVYFVRQRGYLQARLLQSCLTNQDWYDIWQVGVSFIYCLKNRLIQEKIYKKCWYDNNQNSR